MEFFDIHAHILPGVDDGARDIEESLSLLKMLKSQGVTAVAATPHFIATRDILEDFNARVNSAKESLQAACKNSDLPQVLVGSEVLYFSGMGALEGVKNLTINNSGYMLIEFAGIDFTEDVCRDIKRIRENWSITPIIAHIERYKGFKGYKNLLKLVKAGCCLAQVNAASVAGGYFEKTAHKLIRTGMVQFLGTDTHSVDLRPPMLDTALSVIAEKHGKETAEKFIENSNKLLLEINK